MRKMGGKEDRAKRGRRQFTAEFKAGAVRLVLDEGKTIAEVARDLDLTPSALSGWVRRARADRDGGKSGLTSDERAELARLRKDNRELKLERDLLKKRRRSRLLGLSREADIAGGNRLAPSIGAAVASAATVCGPNALARLNNATSGSQAWFKPNSRHWIDGILDALPTLTLDKESFLVLWPTFLSQLSWREKDDIDYLHNATNRLDSYASLRGLALERSRLEQVSRAEWIIARSSPREIHNRVPSEGENELVAEFRQGSIPDAIRRLIACTKLLSRLSDVWHASETIAQRIHEEHPEGEADLGWALFSALSDHREMRAASWSFEGLEQTVHCLAPVLTESQQWEVVRVVIGRLDERDNLAVTRIVDDLDGWCRAVAPQDRLERGLEKHLQTQEQWLPPGRALRLLQLEAVPEPATWSDFAVSCILDALNSDSGVLNLASMRAMLILLRLNSRAFDLLLQKATTLARPDREAVAQLAEYVALADPVEFARFEQFLQHCEQSRCFELELQAWIARWSHARGTGQELPSLILSPPIAAPPVIASPNRLVIGTPDRRAATQSAMGMQAVAAVLRQLQYSVNLNGPKVESAFLAAIEKDPVHRSSRPERVRDGDNQYISTDEVERLYDLLRSVFEGPIDEKLAVRLAQGALMQDEPSVLFGDWPVRLDIWPTDELLKTLLDQGQLYVRQRLSSVLDDGLGDDEIVLAGTLYTPAYGCEMLLYRLPWFRIDENTVEARSESTTFGGRMFSYTEPERFDADEDEPPPCWLARLSRGLTRAPHQNIGVILSSRLQIDGGWVADTATRGTFIAGDGSCVRYERVLGSPRAQARALFS